MARSFKVKAPFNVAMRLLIPTSEKVQGVVKKSFIAPEDAELFYGSFRTFGGTETIENGVYTLVNTATINTWYRPDITANCRIYLCETKQVYEIVADPEDIDFRHQYLQLKVKKVGGKP